MDFSLLGLNSNQGKVYELLLRKGKLSASEISRESKVPYGRIYTVLGSLESLGIIQIVPENPKKYIPADPKFLDKIISDRLKSFSDLKKDIEECKKLYSEEFFEPVQVVRDRHNFYKLIREMPKPKKYTYSIKYNFEPHPEFIRQSKENIKSNVEHKTLGRIDNETRKNVEMFKKLGSNIKPIPNEGVAMSLIDGEQLLFVFLKSNTIMLIRDEPFIKIMTELFKSYYDTH